MTNLAFFVYSFVQGFNSVQANFRGWQRLMGAKPSRVRTRFFYQQLNEVPSLIKYSEANEPEWEFFDWIGNMEIFVCPKTGLFWVVYRNNGYGGMQPARTYEEMREVCAEMEATPW